MSLLTDLENKDKQSIKFAKLKRQQENKQDYQRPILEAKNIDVIETFVLDFYIKPKLKTKNLYIVDLSNNNYSDYIEVYDNTVAANTVLPKESTANDTDNDVFLGGGANGALPDSGDYVGTATTDTGTGWHTFYNVNNLPVQILCSPCPVCRTDRRAFSGCRLPAAGFARP